MVLYLKLGIFRNSSLLRQSWIVSLLWALPFGAEAIPPQATASSSNESLSNCSLYRSKRKEVPVFAEPSTTSEIIDRLGRSEKICYIGETKDFAIAQWDKQALLRNQSPEPTPRLGYIRLVELWEPRTSPGTLSKQAQEQYRYQQQGGVSDDPFWYFRSLVNWAFPFDPCKDPNRIGCQPATK